MLAISASVVGGMSFGYIFKLTTGWGISSPARFLTPPAAGHLPQTLGFGGTKRCAALRPVEDCSVHNPSQLSLHILRQQLGLVLGEQFVHTGGG